MATIFLREAVVCERLGISRSTLWVRIKAGLVPPPIKNGRLSVWPDDEIAAVQKRLREARDAGQSVSAAA